jgi:hypothetical protein
MIVCSHTNIFIFFCRFPTPYFFLDVSSRFQCYLWQVDSADSQNMIDCDKPVVMWPNVSVKKIFFELHPIYCSCWSQTSTLYYELDSINVIMLLIITKLGNLNKQMFLSESFYGTRAWWKSLNGVCTLIIFHYVRAQWNNVTVCTF